jgi:hypothetical protein
MLNMECKTKMSGEDVLRKLKQFFGKGGLGLDLTEASEACLTFAGGGGYVTATLCQEEGGQTRVDFLTQEWDYQVKQFAAGLR